MTRLTARFNMQGATLPLLVSQGGRSVIDVRGDLTFYPDVTTEGDVPKDRGIPSILYAHNVMPSAYGWQSVGYTEIVPFYSGLAGGEVFVNQQKVFGATIPTSMPESSGLKTYIAVTHLAAQTKFYYLTGANVWSPVLDSAGTPIVFAGLIDISVAHVNGYSYILIPHYNVGVLDISTGKFLVRTLASLTLDNIIGLLSISGYLLTYTKNSYAWSSTINVEDFLPSEVSGAGGGSIQEIDGDIVVGRTLTGGFILFTRSNAVAGLYTGNTAFPFELREMPSVGGVASDLQVSAEVSNGSYYAITGSGIQSLSFTAVKNALIPVSDFIFGRDFEDLDESTYFLTKYSLAADMIRAIQVIANRYIVVSYGAGIASTDYTHAIIVDVSQGRMGKLRIPHRKCFALQEQIIGTDVDARSSIGFLQATGAVKKLSFEVNRGETSGVLLYGKIQYVRSRMLELQEVLVDGVRDGGTFSISDLPSLLGDNYDLPANSGYYDSTMSSGTSKRYLFHTVAENHVIAMKGEFNIPTFVASFNLHGRLR